MLRQRFDLAYSPTSSQYIQNCTCVMHSFQITTNPVLAASSQGLLMYLGGVKVDGSIQPLLSSTCLPDQNGMFIFPTSARDIGYDTEQFSAIEVIVVVGGQNHTTRIAFPPVPVNPNDPGQRSMGLPLRSTTGVELFVNVFFTCTETTKDYEFHVRPITHTLMDAGHIRDVLHHLPLMAPAAMSKTASPCQYNDHVLASRAGTNAFTMRVVHSQNPTLSAVEILDVYQNTVATAHTIGAFSLPEPSQVKDSVRSFTHKPSLERSMLIRGVHGDWGLIKASWRGFVKGTRSKRGQPGSLKITAMTLKGKESRMIAVSNSSNMTITFSTGTGSVTVDLVNGKISLTHTISDVPEHVCLGCSVAVLFVLCQPRPPPPVAGRYEAPPDNHPRVMNVDAMPWLVAGGLYATMLPRWYHVGCHGDYFYQIHPHYIHHHHYGGGCGAPYDYDSGGTDFHNADGDGAPGFDGGDSGGGDFAGFDAGGGDWGGDGGDGGGGCGGCGGGDGGGGGGGCGGCGGGGCGGGGGGCG